MLGKLMKYELKATSRWFLPLYCGIIIFAIFSKISTTIINLEGIQNMSSENPFINLIVNTATMVSFFLYAIIIITTIIMTFVIAIRRFYKNLLSDEGYLMFTLPVSTHKLILSKFLSTLIWYICSIAVIILSIFILSFDKNFFYNLSQLPYIISTAFKELQQIPQFLSFMLLLCISFLISFPSMVIMIYVSIAIGHTRHNHRVLYSFGAFLGLNIIISIISNVLSYIILIPNSKKLGYAFEYSITPYGNISDADSLALINQSFGFVNNLLIFSIIFSILISVGFYFLTNFILSKKLNLE